MLKNEQIKMETIECVETMKEVIDASRFSFLAETFFVFFHKD